MSPRTNDHCTANMAGPNDILCSLQKGHFGPHQAGSRLKGHFVQWDDSHNRTCENCIQGPSDVDCGSVRIGDRQYCRYWSSKDEPPKPILHDRTNESGLYRIKL